MRARLDLAYDGADFSGWARQPGLRTVQGTLESAIAQVLRLDEPPSSVCAGRTDAGVHARGQVVHMDLPEEVARPHKDPHPTEEALLDWLPKVLPPDIALHAVRRTTEDFDARFSAISRRYVYRLWDCPHTVDPLSRSYAVAFSHPVDTDAMSSAAERLLGLHDFAAFCRRRDEGTTIRTLLRCEVDRRPDDLIEITVQADAFCHSMVRSLVGALVTVGRHRRDIDWIDSHLQADRRGNDILVMPPHGLTLEEVEYPPEDRLAERALQARSRRGSHA
ncbi:MAG: tRNA pseudouridine(38-40) synthase TruA [Propionibacteriaceae bacterium]|nr:tRNA pseudouridine(38-40) synthase TruA [Propionibacteriaceae bacterium]